MWLERLSGGGADLIGLRDMKSFLQILVSDFDDDLSAAIASASAALDVDENGFGGLGFPLVAQQWAQKGAGFNAEMLRLPFSRIASVDDIRFTSPDGQSGSVGATEYHLMKRGRQWSVSLRSGARWPELAARPDAAQLHFSAGWPDAASVPADIKGAARLLGKFFFEAGAGSDEGDVPDEIARGVDRLTSRYRRFAI